MNGAGEQDRARQGNGVWTSSSHYALHGVGWPRPKATITCPGLARTLRLQQKSLYLVVWVLSSAKVSSWHNKHHSSERVEVQLPTWWGHWIQSHTQSSPYRLYMNVYIYGCGCTYWVTLSVQLRNATTWWWWCFCSSAWGRYTQSPPRFFWICVFVCFIV